MQEDLEDAKAAAREANAATKKAKQTGMLADHQGAFILHAKAANLFSSYASMHYMEDESAQEQLHRSEKHEKQMHRHGAAIEAKGFKHD
jgi:hypothetical protein